MKYKMKFISQLLLIICILIISGYKQPSQIKEQTTTQSAAQIDPFASWNDGNTKKTIIDFIIKTTKEGSADFIPVADRIACFDNDGTRKRPVFSSGNSDGDYAMLQWTSTATGYPRFGMIVHHTDAEREWAYDRESHIGKLQKGLDDAAKYKWTIVDMKKDWKLIYPFERK